MADLLRDAEIDVIGLLESDVQVCPRSLVASLTCQHSIMGNRDLTQYIAHEHGYYVDIGPSPQSHTWGAASVRAFRECALTVQATEQVADRQFDASSPAVAPRRARAGHLRHPRRARPLRRCDRCA